MNTANDYDKYAHIRQQDILSGRMKSHQYIEKPMMRNLIPSLSGKKILCLGCGTGDETILLEEFGAQDIVGIDISQTSITIARETYQKHKFIVGDMEKIPFEDESFDFVYSSLSVHYTENIGDVYNEVHRVLKPGGTFLFSTLHPFRWASEDIYIDDISTKVLGVSNDKLHPRIIGGYMTLKKYRHQLPQDEILEMWCGAPSYHFKLLKQSNFQVEEFVESQATQECESSDNYYYQRYHEFPMFIAFLAVKK